MKKHKLILFDWGNIVEDGDSCKQSWFNLFNKCGYNADDTRTRIRNYELSAIKTMDELEDTYKEMKKDFNLKVDFKEFKKLYLANNETIKYYPEIAGYEHSLKDKCYIGILSNLCILDKDRIDKQLGLANYDYTFLSFEIGIKKPHKEIFEYVMNNTDFKPEDILFIDDKDKNIETAKSMGWHTLKATHNDFDLIKEECERFIEGKQEKYYIYEMNMDLLNILTIPLFVTMMIITFLVKGNINLPMKEIAILIFLMMPYLALHEIIHAIAYIVNGANYKRVTFGAHLEKNILCCLCKQNVTKKNILISLISPFMVIGIITYIIGLIINNNLLIYLSIINISGCTGDLIMFYNFIKIKDFAYAEYDNPTAFGLYSKNDLANKKMYGLKYVETKNELIQTITKKIDISKTSVIWFVIMLICGLVCMFL